MAEKKQRQMQSLDEVSLKQWIILLVVHFLVGAVAYSFVGVPVKALELEGDWAWLPDVLSTLLIFTALFASFAFFLPRICRVSLRAFLVGDEGVIDWRQTGVICAIYLVSALVVTFVSAGFGANLTLNSASAASILACFLICLALSWTQTTWEELIFRGLAMRWACGNKISPTRRCMVAAVVISLAFMAVHFTNPEVTSQTDPLQLVMALLYYFCAGFFLYLVDIAFGNLMPAVAIHWVNNFMGFAVIGQAGTALMGQTLVIDHSVGTGAMNLLVGILAYTPVLIYSWNHYRKVHA